MWEEADFWGERAVEREEGDVEGGHVGVGVARDAGEGAVRGRRIPEG